MASKVLTALSLIVELISTVLLFYIAYLTYKNQCVQTWLLITVILIPLLIIMCTIYVVFSNLNVDNSKDTMNKIVLAILLLLLIAGVIFKIWFFIKMMGCEDVNIYLKVAFIISIPISGVIAYYNNKKII